MIHHRHTHYSRWKKPLLWWKFFCTDWERLSGQQLERDWVLQSNKTLNRPLQQPPCVLGRGPTSIRSSRGSIDSSPSLWSHNSLSHLWMRQCRLVVLICVFGVICYTARFLPRDVQRLSGYLVNQEVLLHMWDGLPLTVIGILARMVTRTWVGWFF